MRRTLFALITSVALTGIVACDATEPAGDPVELSYAPCLGTSDYPTWFAAQDGDEAWQRVNPTATGAFTFTISRGRGGIAMYSAGEGLYVVYASTQEMQSYFLACNGSVRTVVGAVSGYTSQDNVNIQMGNELYVVLGTEAAPASFALQGVDATATDLVAVRYRSLPGTSTFEYIPDNVFIRRGVTGTSTGAVSFASTTEAGAPVQKGLTVTNVASGEELTVLSNLSTNSTLALLADYETSASIATGPVSVPFYGLAAARLVSGESHFLHVTAGKRTSTTASEARVGALTFTDAVDKSMTLGPALGAVTVTGSARPSASYTIQAEYASLWDVVFSQGNDASARQNEVLMTKGYLGSASTVTLAVPNLSSVSGFQASWLLATGATANWAWLAANADLSVLTNRPSAFQAAAKGNAFTP